MFKDTKTRFRSLLSSLRIARATWRGYKHRNSYDDSSRPDVNESQWPDEANPLWKYFAEHKEGRGIWKFKHYFESYHRHFARFRGHEVNVLEIGIYSGGSLDMWRNYFGPRCRVYGVDIEPRCKIYEGDSVSVFIGDQADRNFWKRFKKEAPILDIVIDDGGHLPEQQIVSLEELLPHLRPGGVYLCEDTLNPFNEFASYVHGLAQHLNSADQVEYKLNDNERRSVYKTNPLQSAVGSIHLYPYMTVIERTPTPVSELIAPKHGTQWEPFLR